MNSLPNYARISCVATLLFLTAACSQPDEAVPLVSQATYPTSLRLYLASDNSDGHVWANLGPKETLRQTCPLAFNTNANPGRLLTFAATGSSARVCYAGATQQLGVFSSGEGAAKKYAVNGGETVSVALGDDITLVGLKAISATVSVQQTKAVSRFRVRFYDGATLLGAKEYSPTGSGTGPMVFRMSLGGMPKKPFTKLVFSPVVGSFSLKGGRNVLYFTLAKEFVVNVQYDYGDSQDETRLPGTWPTTCSGSEHTAPDKSEGDRTISAAATVIFPFDGSPARLGGGAYVDTTVGDFENARSTGSSRTTADFLAQQLTSARIDAGTIEVAFEGPTTNNHRVIYCGKDVSEEPQSGRSGAHQLFYFTWGTGSRVGRDEKSDGCEGGRCTIQTVRDSWRWSVGTR